MAVAVILPRLDQAMRTGRIARWTKNEGDWVEKEEGIVEIETEKVTSDVEAEASGYLHIVVKEGNEAPIASVIGLIAETKEELEVIQREPPKETIITVTEPKEAPPIQAAAPAVAKTREGERIRISPVARKMAEEQMIDIASIAGTGPGGRIVREDIEKAIETKKKAEVTPVVYQGKRVKSTIPLKGIRKAIAEHLHHSLSISAQLTAMGEIDMTEVVKLRKTLVDQAEVIGSRITYTDIFVLAIAQLLQGNPIINASLIDNEIKFWENINVGVAVALEDGLIVPVVKDADKKSLVEISRTVRTLKEKAREGKLVPGNTTGGTFTITNLGALGGGYRFETVIINQPESAILGTGGITDRVVVRDGQIVIRPMMTYYFTYDHRLINGAVAAKFMANVTKLLESQILLLV